MKNKTALYVLVSLTFGLAGGYVINKSLNVVDVPLSKVQKSSNYGLGDGVNSDSNMNNLDKKNCLADDCLSVANLDYPVSSLSEDAKIALGKAIEDEYKAFSVYEKTIEKLGMVRPFSMIIRAEESHISALKSIFDKSHG